MFFFEKKNHKTFTRFVAALPTHSETKWTKVFCFFFSKKKRLLSCLQSETFNQAATSPTTPRRNASTQMTKIAPCVTVTHAPNWAR